MWNPIVVLDFNNLWRTMDEMGREVKTRHTLVTLRFGARLVLKCSCSLFFCRTSDPQRGSLEGPSC